MKKVILQTNVDKVEQIFEEASTVVIVTHISPDGDAVGSSLALRHFLETKGKMAHVIVPNAFPDFLKWMPGAKDILRYDKYGEFARELIGKADLICCLDFNVLKRIDNLAEPVRDAKCKKIMIDHHLDPERFCDVTISHPQIASTSELIFRLICCLSCFNDITLECAQCIYTGMMTDTGGFTFNSNSEDIYFIISQLISKGIDKDEIYRNVFNTYSEGRLRLMGYVLYKKMQFFSNFNSALICLSKNELGNFHFNKGDTEGFVNMPLQVKGIRFSAFLREDTEKKMIKVSLRSTGDFPCNDVAKDFFGGGGHKNASGGEVYGTMEQAVALFMQALIKYETLLKKK